MADAGESDPYDDEVHPVLVERVSFFTVELFVFCLFAVVVPCFSLRLCMCCQKGWDDD